jgi:hypothetical protein
MTADNDRAYDAYDELEEAALARLRDDDARSEQDTDTEEGGLCCESAVQTVGRMCSL